jgi:hypothetical protein
MEKSSLFQTLMEKLSNYVTSKPLRVIISLLLVASCIITALILSSCSATRAGYIRSRDIYQHDSTYILYSPFAGTVKISERSSRSSLTFPSN